MRITVIGGVATATVVLALAAQAQTKDDFS